MRKIFWKAADAVFVTRPLLLIPVWGYFVLGYYRASLLNGGHGLTPTSLNFPVLLKFSSPEAAAGLIFFSILILGAYLINQIVDVDIDRQNSGLPLIAKAGFSAKFAAVETALLFAAPLAYALHVGGKIGALFFLSFLLAVVYSIKPFRFCGRPFLDFLSNAVGYGLFAFGMGWLFARNGELGNLKEFILQSAPYFLLILGGSINSTVVDEEGDRAGNKMTTVIFLGRRWAGAIAAVATALVLVFSIRNRDIIAGLTGLVSLPFYIRFAVTTCLKDVFVTYQHCGAFMMFLVVAIYPLFLLYGIAAFLLTRAYFRYRHNTVYPNPGA